MKSSEFKILISVEGYNEKTAVNDRNCYVVEKCCLQTIYQIYRYQIWITQIEDLNEDGLIIAISYLLYFPRINPSKSVTVELGRVIVLNDSVSTKMGIKVLLKFFH